MKINWVGESGAPRELLEKIESYLSLSQGGGVSFDHAVDWHIDALLMSVEHLYDLDHETLYQFLHATIFDEYKQKEKLDGKRLIQKLKERCDVACSQLTNYVLVTSINIEKAWQLKRRTILGCTINFNHAVPKKYRDGREKLLEIHSDLKLKQQSNYTTVTISVKAANYYHAYNKSMKSLAVLRGLITLGFEKPINVFASSKEDFYYLGNSVKVGQMHSIHLVSGKLATETVWYERDFREKGLSMARFDDMQLNFDVAIKRIRKNKLKEHIEASLIGYIEALEKNDSELVFLKVWSALEMITKADTTKDLARKIAFLFDDSLSHRQIIKAIRQARNSFAHASKIPNNTPMKNFVIVRYLESILKFLIHDDINFKSVDEFVAFLESSTEVSQLDGHISTIKSKVSLLEKSKKYRIGQ